MLIGSGKCGGKLLTICLFWVAKLLAPQSICDEPLPPPLCHLYPRSETAAGLGRPWRGKGFALSWMDWTLIGSWLGLGKSVSYHNPQKIPRVKSGKFFRCKGISATAFFRWDISVTAILDKNDVFGQERLKILRNWATTKISTTWKFQVCPYWSQVQPITILQSFHMAYPPLIKHGTWKSPFSSTIFPLKTSISSGLSLLKPPFFEFPSIFRIFPAMAMASRQSSAVPPGQRDSSGDLPLWGPAAWLHSFWTKMSWWI